MFYPRIYSSCYLLLLCAMGIFPAFVMANSPTTATIKAASKSVITDKNSIHPLFLAAFKGDCTQVKALLQKGVSIDQTTLKNTAFPLGLINNQKGKSTALMLASFAGHLAMVKFLLAQGAQVNLQDDLGQTALMYAILSDTHWPHRPLSEKHKEIIRLLLAHHANPCLEDALGQNAAYYYSFLARLVPGQGEFGYEDDPAAAQNDPLYQALIQS